MKIIRWLFGIAPKSKGLRPAKDPLDWTKTESSTHWSTDRYCPQCKGTAIHDDIMAGVCHRCGFLGSLFEFRSYRKIWDGKEWVTQARYKQYSNEYVIGEFEK